MLLSEAKQILKKNGYRLTETRRDISFKRNRISDIKKIVAENTKHLKVLIAEEIKKNGPNCSLNHIDVSNITNMGCIFYDTNFNGDISEWDVSNVIDMESMFAHSKFNGDISKWDVSNVTDMHGMFRYSKFNGDISEWDVSNVTNMNCMFLDSKFNGDISKWNVSNVENMDFIFENSKFNRDISNWKLNDVVEWSDLVFPDNSLMSKKIQLLNRKKIIKDI